MLETKETITVEHKHFDENNNERIVGVSARLVKNPEGKTVVIHVARDITERKHMETRIREAEKRYHALFDRAPFGILVFDAENATIVEFMVSTNNPDIKKDKSFKCIINAFFLLEKPRKMGMKQVN